MEDRKDQNDKKFKYEIRNLAIFLASGVFAKLHRKFLAPSSEIYCGDQVVNWLHHIFHAAIGLAIQIVLILLLVKFVVAAFKAVVGEIKSRGEQDGN